ncbi:hypothetical protein TNCV_3865301 [Trichonephila clavipes]|nr:hypothetical protein TNCV_3865301 [Trichonephila clavipes]
MKIKQITKTPTKNGEGGRTPKHERSNEAERRRGEGKNAGRKAGWPKAVNQGGEISPKNPEMRIRKQCLCFDNWIVMRFYRFKDISREFSDLDTLRENCGIIRKQANTDGGMFWKVVRVNVVQVQRKDRSLRDPREARSRVRV